MRLNQKKKIFSIILLLALLALIILSFASGNLYLVFFGEKKESPRAPLLYSEEHHLGEMSSSSAKTEQVPTSIIDRIHITSFRKISSAYRADIPLEDIKKYYDLIGPSAMLNIIEEEEFCHTKGHNIGKVILEKTRDLGEAMNICGTRCAGGCYHGVFTYLFRESKKKMESQFDESGQETTHFFFEDVKEEIEGICQRPEVTKVLGANNGNCYHASGHAILFLENYDLKKAMDDCEVFRSKGEVAVYYCASGAYMERDMAFKKTDSKISPTFPCDQIKDHPAACYRYRFLGELGRNDSSKAISLCLGLNESQRRGCFHGIGFSYFYYIFKEPSLINTVCTKGNLQDNQMCIEGAIGMIDVFDLRKGIEVCKSLPKHLQQFCSNHSKISNFGMERDPKRYYYKS